MKCLNCNSDLEINNLTHTSVCSCGLEYSAIDIFLLRKIKEPTEDQETIKNNSIKIKFLKEQFNQILKDIGPATGGQSHYDWIVDHGKEITILKDLYRELISLTQRYFKFELKWIQNGIGNEAGDQVRSLCDNLSRISHKLWQIEKGDIKRETFEIVSHREDSDYKPFFIKSKTGYYSSTNPLEEIVDFMEENMDIEKDYEITVKIEIKRIDSPENKEGEIN